MISGVADKGKQVREALLQRTRGERASEVSSSRRPLPGNVSATPQRSSEASPIRRPDAGVAPTSPQRGGVSSVIRDRSTVSSEARRPASEASSEDGIRDRFRDAWDGVRGFFSSSPESRRFEEHDPDARIAVFDSFRGGSDGESTHGELVEGVIQAEGFKDEDVQRYQIDAKGSLSDLKRDLERGRDEGLDGYIEDRFTGLLDNSRGGLEEILNDDDSKITVVNQSQSVAEARVARDLWDEVKSDDSFRSDLSKSLELPTNASDRELAQALVDHIGDVADSSDKIAESQERYDEVSRRAADAGIAHVVTSGNLGSFADELSELGVRTDRQFFRSALANEHKTIVGAVDDRSRSASFNSPRAGAEVSAPGVDLEITTQEGQTERKNGTSFAAPQVAALIAQVQEANPDLSPQEIENLIRSEASRGRGPRHEIGTGVIDPEAVLEEAA